jgi:hypothetical protein
VVEGLTGHVVPVGRPDLIAERTLSLLAEPARLEEMGTDARDHIRRLYDETRLLAEFADFWRMTSRQA